MPSLGYGLTITFLLLLVGCTLKKELPQDYITELNAIQSKWAPDKRTKVFNIEHNYDAEHGIWNITGETTEKQAQQAFEKLVLGYFGKDKINLNFQLLPHPSLGDSIYGLVNVSVANLKKEPGHRTELVDQALMGTVLKLLKLEHGWYLVQTPSDYLGWITSGTVSEITPTQLLQWQKQEKVILDVNFTQVFASPSENSQIICDAVLGCVFKKTEVTKNWQGVETPDGRLGFVARKMVKTYQPVDNNKLPNRKDVIDLAKKMMGIPYLWGGNSTKGLDCSGYTSTVFHTLGYQLPRDANMQVELGREIIPKEDFSNVLPGDLIFFGPEGRITHVGICLGGSYYIHASNDVHINSLDEQDKLFNAERKKAFKIIKRLIKD